MHVHVFSPDGEAKFWLEPQIELALNKGLRVVELTNCVELLRNGRMKSDSIGAGTSGVEILNVSPHGFWLMVGEREYLLDFDQFPWFRQATLEQLFRAELLHGAHLYWPGLDVDLDLDRIQHPERYPLVARAENQREQGGAANRSQPPEPGSSRTSPGAGSGR